ncbi:4901_t:CDS:10 [Acaulospora morrowiae]|uniref:4901_t:CDS:1 n=1 Tax=Acaulospora morrowiae TaxID=94023 RepID=A0A9N9EII7_9GLOM|nr:4901_t:CDS:10 [Acaulospora morrowiae]
MAQTYGQQQAQQPQIPEYTLPGVIHFLQSEWRRFERDRNEWEIERAEMKARIALLEGERRGIEKMKVDLMKRIKMLEFALRKERSKYLAGVAPNPSLTKESSSSVTTPANEEGPGAQIESVQSSEQPVLQHKNITSSRDPKYRIKSREILKACLQEIDYLTNAATSNTPIVNRLSNHPTGLDGNNAATRKSNNRNSAVYIGLNANTYNGVPLKKPGNAVIRPSRPAPSTPLITSRNSSPPLENPMSSGEDLDVVFSEQEEAPFFPRSGGELVKRDTGFTGDEQSSPIESDFEKNYILEIASREGMTVGNGTDESMKNTNSENGRDHDRNDGSSTNNKFKYDGEWKIANKTKNKSKLAHSKNADELKEEEEQLTKDVQKKFNLSDEKVIKLMKNAKGRKSHEILSANTSDPLLDELSLSVEEDESTQKPESELLFASGSEDGTIKLWDLKGPASQKPAAVPDIEPLMTYRGHTAAVNSVVLGSEQRRCYSASMDSTIRVWNLPPPKREIYGPVDLSLNLNSYIGHTDAIWDLRLFPINSQNTRLLASASADGTVKVWDTEAEGSPLKCSWGYYGSNGGEIVNGGGRPPVPTSVAFVHNDLKKIAVSFQNSIIKLFDIETGQEVLAFKSDETYDNSSATQINRIISHPTLPLLFSAHEDKYIRIFDVNSGNCSFSMIAHLDSVTSLDVDPSGMVLISGGHDSSIRLWDIVSTRQCIQEFALHRSKSDEGVLCVQYHSSLPWIASGGADSVVKIYC